MSCHTRGPFTRSAALVRSRSALNTFSVIAGAPFILERRAGRARKSAQPRLRGVEPHHLHPGAAPDRIGMAHRLSHLVVIVALRDKEPDGLSGRAERRRAGAGVAREVPGLPR